MRRSPLPPVARQHGWTLPVGHPRDLAARAHQPWHELLADRTSRYVLRVTRIAGGHSPLRGQDCAEAMGRPMNENRAHRGEGARQRRFLFAAAAVASLTGQGSCDGRRGVRDAV